MCSASLSRAEFFPESDAVSLDLTVESPENVLLTYELAGPAARCLAFGLDAILRMVFLGVVLLAAALTSPLLPGVTWGAVLLLLFVLEWGYHIICEGLFRGQTVGKEALGLRVIQSQGYPITFWSAMQRNLLRAVDGIPLIAFLALIDPRPLQMFSLTPDLDNLWMLVLLLPVYGPALFAMMLTRRFQRLGDLAAGTVVISERHSRLRREPVILSKIEPLAREEIGAYQPEMQTLALIDDFLSRRGRLSHERGHELCADLAQVLARKLEFQGDPYQLRDYPMSFLARVYVTFVRKDEAELPPLSSTDRRKKSPQTPAEESGL